MSGEYTGNGLAASRKVRSMNSEQSGYVRIGISGWTYPAWRAVFYPANLPQKRELEYSSHTFPTIEIKGTFYSLQTPKSFLRWKEETPGNFVFSVKGPRFITHVRRLRDAEVPLANFFASGLLSLDLKLGPILWQLPPNFKFSQICLKGFSGSCRRQHKMRQTSQADVLHG